MSLYTIRQGETIALQLTVLDENGVAMPLGTSATTNVIVTLENKGSKFAQYSLIDMGVDFGELTVNDNIITIITSRDETKLWDTGIAKAVVTIEQDDVVLTHKVYDFAVENYLTIESSANKDITLLHS